MRHTGATVIGIVVMKLCPQCGAKMNPEQFGGLCPACLMDGAFATSAETAALDASEEDTFGHYRIIRSLGEGGMGTVYLAEQSEPIRRHVALKLVKLGMDTNEVLSRFRNERQALALMDHPNVARIFDAGASS